MTSSAAPLRRMQQDVFLNKPNACIERTCKLLKMRGREKESSGFGTFGVMRARKM